MKKILLAALSIIGVQSSSFAQNWSAEKDSIKAKGNFFVGVGVVTTDGYNIDKKLAMANLPSLPSATPEFTFGFNGTWKKWLADIEFSGNYLQQRRGANKVNYVGATILTRVHYMPMHNEKMFLSVGADLAYTGNNVDIFNDNNVIDLNDLNPLNNGGHVGLRNEMLYAGPSASFGFLQNTEWPLRLNVGYQWALTNGKWRSDFADVTNTVKENGQGRFYAKVLLYL